MHWTIAYVSETVQAGIFEMPAGLLARYLRYTDRMEVYGPDLGMPHTRAMGEGLFELREGFRRNCQGILLHSDWPQDRHVAPLHQENRKDATQ